MVRHSNLRSFKTRHRVERFNNRQDGRRTSLEKESSNWRLSLYTIFVSNLDRQITARDLWRMFNVYGVVVDVFLPNGNSFRSTWFAFVRYRYPEEYRRVVMEGNELMVAGRKLVVRQATERRIDRRQQGRKVIRNGRSTVVGGTGAAPRQEEGYGALGTTKTEILQGKDVRCGQENKWKPDHHGQIKERKVEVSCKKDHAKLRQKLVEVEQEKEKRERRLLSKYT